jgi:DNA-directed RNA polymerase specialized sigma24 family protein
VLAEKRYDLEPADPMTPERIFEKRWALSLLDQVLARLRDEEAAEGRLRQFVRLQPFLTGADTQTTQAAVAAELGTSEGTIKQRLLRLRQRYRELVRAEVAQTVATAGEVEAELRHLIAVLRG